MSECDVCKLEFPSSKPLEAVADVSLGGPWGYVCETHLRHGMTGTLFQPRPCKCGKPTKKIHAGKPKCQACLTK